VPVAFFVQRCGVCAVNELLEVGLVIGRRRYRLGRDRQQQQDDAAN
jgi:hypothetical protein